MEITKATTWILRVPFVRTSRDFEGAQHELVGVTLHCPDGVTGTGFTFTADYGGGTAIKALLDDLLLDRVIGRDVHETRRIWRDLSAVTHRLGRGINNLALAAIDIALWDAKAKSHGRSLARELGQTRELLPAYGSGKASPHLPVGELVELARGYVEQGFRALKLRVGLDAAADVERVTAVRDAVGGDVRIMCDANERLDLPEALWLGHRLAGLGVSWFEEPVASHDIQSHRRLVEALPIPIAAGEHLCSAREFLPFVDARALDVLQPNACMVGGVTEMMRIGELAELHGLGFAPHFMTELHIHIAAALPGCTTVEYFPFLDEYIQQPLTVRNGELVVPDCLGHGIVFQDWVWDRYRVA